MPYKWNFKTVKLSKNILELHCTIYVNDSWHTYSQFTPQGGPVPTKFIFVKNPFFSLDGSVVENGNMITRREEVFDVDIKYFENKVDFVQKIRLKSNAKTNIGGSVEFMVCNNLKCLPPETMNFSIDLNE